MIDVEITLSKDGYVVTPSIQTTTLHSKKPVVPVEPKTVDFISLTSNGVSETTNTTIVIVTLSEDIENLTIDNFTFSSFTRFLPSIQITEFESLGDGVYELLISGTWDNNQEINLTLNVDDITILPNSRTLTLYAWVNNTDPIISDKSPVTLKPIDPSKPVNPDNNTNQSTNPDTPKVETLPKTGVNSQSPVYLIAIMLMLNGVWFSLLKSKK